MFSGLRDEFGRTERERAIQQRLQIALSAADQGVWDFDLVTRETIPATLVSAIGIPAIGVPREACSLDPNVMAEHGGSLIVEGLQDEPTLQYRIHWAGSATSRAASDCGKSASLVVSRTDLQRLANAAGGFGVGEKGSPR